MKKGIWFAKRYLRWSGYGNSFFSINGSPFGADNRSIGLMMNIDWVQPFKNRNDYSVCVIYFVLLNLPGKTRFKAENVIVAGFIPTFKKEPNSNNSFLEPIVKELQVLWRGVRLVRAF